MIINFKNYLIEQEDKPQSGEKLTHARHIEDLGVYHGHRGVSHAASILQDMDRHLRGESTPDTHFSEKYDGAPSIVAGYHPVTEQFFVATKSAFGKNPKINYTDEDIERNHGHAPGLVEKLKEARKQLIKVMPKHGVYQGDLMYTKDDVEDRDGQYHFKPNTISYSTNKDSAEGKRIKNAKLGVVFHTQYKGKDIEDMSAEPLIDRSQFREHPDVHNINPAIQLSSTTTYTPEMQKQFQNHMENARRTYESMKPESMDTITPHAMHVEAHVNDMIRKGGVPSTDGLIKHIQARMEREAGKLKTAAGKQRKIQEHQDIIDHISNNREHFDKTFELHKHLQNAKNVLVKAFDSSSSYDHHVGDVKTGSEGVAIVRKGLPGVQKAVNRDEFSKLNFLQGKFQK